MADGGFELLGIVPRRLQSRPHLGVYHGTVLPVLRGRAGGATPA